MRRLGAVLVTITLAAASHTAIAAHNYGQLGVNPAIVTDVVQLTYPGSAGTPAGWFTGNDWSQCWGPNPWSADGSKIVFTSSIPGECSGRGCNELVMMGADGGAIERLTTNSTCDSHASFAPPGTATVIFQADVDDFARIFSLNVATKAVTNLTEAHTHVATCPGEDEGYYTENKPAVSPDGQHIAYRSCDASLWVMDIDGTDPVEIVPGGSDVHHHTWDPTSTWLAYAVGCDTGYGRVYRARADGAGDPELLADHSATQQCANWPSWSPDGTLVAYHLGEGGSENEDEGKAIWLVNPVSKAARPLIVPTNDSDVCGPTSWSPNSRFLAFKMDPDGSDTKRSLHIVELATGSTWPLTTNYWDYRHWFSPDGERILFRDGEGSSGYCRGSRDTCTSSGDLLTLNLADPDVFAGDADLIIDYPVPATTPWGRLALVALVALGGVAMLIRRLS